jgi:hypothetical protein
MPKTTNAPAYAITYTPFAMTRGEDIAEWMRHSLLLALTSYYADQTDATEGENIAAADLALADHVTSSRATVNLTADDLARYLRNVRIAAKLRNSHVDEAALRVAGLR